MLRTLVFFYFLFPLMAFSAEKYAPVSVEMPLHQVGKHSYYVQGAAGIATDNEGFISNAGFVVTERGVVVFDSLGTPSLAWALRQKIAEITDLPVVTVVVSHYHADHIYGLQVFKDEGATIIAPQGVYEYLDSDGAASRLEERQFSLDPWVNDQTYLVVPDQVIDSTLRFTEGGIDFEISYLGSAHSDGDLTMFVVQDGVLYSGDIIFEGRVPFVGDADTRKWLQTLQRLETGKLQALVPGHGPAAADPQAAIRSTRNYLASLREVMGAAIDEMMDFATAFDEADWSEFEDLPAFEAAHRRNAYQVFLSMEAEMLEDE
jgi:glyoxylase-like metal-dependent hydrolase (beta-lactamase superfamily II)